jgi:ferredoxin-NADP reductase
MESTAVRRPPSWQLATVIELVQETPRTKSIVLDLQDRLGHRPGQHVDLRVISEDGYQQRSYSIASAPEDDNVMLTVERIDGGEVSSYLVDELRRGDKLEMRGPVGGYFTWDGAVERPLLLVAGGPGIVPIRSMLRCHALTRSSAPVRLVYSAPSLDELIYRDELLRISARDEMDVSVTLSREQPAGWQGYRGRVGRELLDEVGWPPEDQPLVYVSGPTGFVEAATEALIALGHEPGRIRTERFGRAG